VATAYSGVLSVRAGRASARFAAVLTLAGLLCVACGGGGGSPSGPSQTSRTPSQDRKQECGGAIPCRCGDRVIQDYVLPADLGPCARHGLLVQSAVTLDGGGHHLVGLGNGSEQYGVYLHGSQGATVRNLVVTRFLEGIRLRGATGNQILDNQTLQNGHLSSRKGYGIGLVAGSGHNVIQGNYVSGSADEGIHVGTGGSFNRIVANRITQSSREHLYVLGSDSVVIEGNTIGGDGSVTLYIKDSSNLRVVRNTFLNGPVRIVGNSRDICLSGNQLPGGFLRAETPEPPHFGC